MGGLWLCHAAPCTELSSGEKVRYVPTKARMNLNSEGMADAVRIRSHHINILILA